MLHGDRYPYVITCKKFGDDSLGGLGVARDQILPFPIDFDRCPYNTRTTVCASCVICLHVNQKAREACNFNCLFDHTLFRDNLL